MKIGNEEFSPMYITLVILDLFYAFFCLISIIRLFQILSSKKRYNISIVYYIAILCAMIARGSAFMMTIFDFEKESSKAENNAKNKVHYLFLLVPDMVQICVFLVLVWHFLTHFIISHINVANDVNLFTDKEEDTPKLHKITNNVIYFVIPVYVIVFCIMCLLFVINQMTPEEFMIANGSIGLATPFVFMGYYIFINVKFSGKPYKTKQLEKEITHILTITYIWSLARVFIGVSEIILSTIWNSFFIDYIIDGTSDMNIINCVIVVLFFMLTEFIPVYLSLDSEMMKTFVKDNSTKDNSLLLPNTSDVENMLNNSQQVFLFESSGIESEIVNKNKLNTPKLDIKDIVIQNENEIAIKNEIHSHKNCLGTIYKGEYKGKEVVCRVIKFDRLSRYDLESVSKDIEIILSLTNPFLSTCVGIHIDSNNHKIIILTSYCKNGSLYDYIHEQKQKMTLRSKIGLALDIAKALKYLNENQLNHCHLSSRNVLLQDDLTPLINDFGFVSLFELAEIFNKYHNKNSYSSPEILKDERNVGHTFTNNEFNEKIDVYSFGMLLWELIVETIPFNVKMKEVYDYVVEQKYRPEITKDIDDDIADLIRLCWHSEPKSRPSFDEIIMKLKNKLS